MLGKRGRPSFRRTTSMTEMTVDVSNMMVAPPPPQAAMIGGQFHHMLSPRYLRRSPFGDCPDQTPDFLKRCRLCNRRLLPARDIFMYRGDTAFCSQECREEQMKQDEKKERQAKTEETQPPELAAAAVETETVAAA